MTSDVVLPRQNQDVQGFPQGTMAVALSAVAGAIAVGLLWIATALTAPRPVVRETAVIRPEQGDFKVSYMVQDTETSASGSTMEGVSAIEFHANYVVVRQRDGKGRVFFNERTRQLSWSQ